MSRGRRSERTLAQEQRILAVLDESPRTVREITDILRLQVLEAWAEEEGFEIEWGGDNEPVGARLLAIGTTEQRGIVHVGISDVYPRLRMMEKHGLVERIQLPGHRGMLWRKAYET